MYQLHFLIGLFLTAKESIFRNNIFTNLLVLVIVIVTIMHAKYSRGITYSMEYYDTRICERRAVSRTTIPSPPDVRRT